MLSMIRPSCRSDQEMIENCASIDPPERDGRKHRRHDEWDQHDRADDRLERQVLVEQQREIEPDREFDGAGDAGVEQRVEHREPEHRVAPQPFVVFEADENAGAADARVGEREPDAEPERIGEKQDQERRRRQHEPEAEPIAVDLEPVPRGDVARLRATDLAVRSRCRSSTHLRLIASGHVRADAATRHVRRLTDKSAAACRSAIAIAPLTSSRPVQ